MKASLKFREEQRPLLRVKVPLNIVGLPFQSGIVAGDSKELTLNLGTFFESGPAVKVAYRPNDAWNPFSVVVKTGSGSFGSPISSSIRMSAEFNLLGRGNPNFMLHFKPQFGDFSVKKSQSSVFDGKARVRKSDGSDDDSSIEVVEAPEINGGHFAENGVKKITMLPQKFPAVSAISAMLSGMEVSARTTVPVRGQAVVNFRWGVRVPAEMKTGGGIAFQNFPFLVMNKIGIEHLECKDSKRIAKVSPDLKIPGNSDAAVMAETCLTFMRKSELLQHKNGLLKKEMEDLRRDTCCGNSRISTGDISSGKRRQIDITGKNDRRSNEKSSEVNGYSGKSGDGDAAEE